MWGYQAIAAASNKLGIDGIGAGSKVVNSKEPNLSGRVTSLSTTVPLGGLEGFPFFLRK